MLVSDMEKHEDLFLEELRERLKILGIKAILFDLDDTLIYTQELFIKYMDEFIEKVSRETDLPISTVRSDLERLNDEEYKVMGVNPERWANVVSRMSVEGNGYGDSPINNLDILGNIYIDPPRLKSGVKAILSILNGAKIQTALVTHANVEWTKRKLNSTGLGEYFETIKIVDENRHKGVGDWMEVVMDLGVLPTECLVLGDSLSGDIIPGSEMGARTMWLHTGSSWGMYRKGNVPEDTVHLDEPNQLLFAIERLR